jgi:hypothetical protein
LAGGARDAGFPRLRAEGPCGTQTAGLQQRLQPSLTQLQKTIHNSLLIITDWQMLLDVSALYLGLDLLIGDGELKTFGWNNNNFLRTQ